MRPMPLLTLAYGMATSVWYSSLALMNSYKAMLVTFSALSSALLNLLSKGISQTAMITNPSD